MLILSAINSGGNAITPAISSKNYIYSQNSTRIRINIIEGGATCLQGEAPARHTYMDITSAATEVGAGRPEETAAAEEEKMRVMVAIDDSDESFYALHWVLDNLFSAGVAAQYDDDSNTKLITLIHVMEPFPHYVFPGMQAVFPTTSVIQSVNKAQEENASAMLAQALQMCAQRMVKAKTCILEGDPKEMICDVADQMQVDLIAIGSRGLGKIKRAFMGSVSDYVTHHAKCPVLVIKQPSDFHK
ncbi:Universal stress protein A-like protein [Sesamum alatum]|uniref:Universal stress protein A-like protein n=1 Tax=Sesamum alatum TaxID=300844 RepID=A0AAE2CAI9_9LAMI|nr:Universal stress protein A-like protein [Sesamum alatum]